MSSRRRSPNDQTRLSRGVTLIELVVTIAVLAILAAIAVPTFADFRERSIVRGAADQVVSQVANYRFESVKRNRRVTVGFVGTGTAWCVGASEGDVACDCSAPANTCDVGAFPGAGQDERRGTRATSRTGFGATGRITFDPATGTLTTLTQAGTLTLASPSTNLDYRLQVQVNAMGRATVCVPADSARPVPGYPNC
jgi:prepilin-type N-terminal cleavage/methylation domain-containing protein